MKLAIAANLAGALLVAACNQAQPTQTAFPSETTLIQTSAVWVQDQTACSPDNASFKGMLRITDSELIFEQAHEALYLFSWSGNEGQAITRAYPNVTDRAREKTYVLSLNEQKGRLTVHNRASGQSAVYEPCRLVTVNPHQN